MPALLKLWLDEVLTWGWAYGTGGTALRGKDLWLVASTGGTEASYRPDGHNRHFFDAFLPPYEQTAALCGMRFLPPLLLHGAHHASEAEIAAHAALYARVAALSPCPAALLSAALATAISWRFLIEREDERLRGAARTLGLSEPAVFFRISLPLAWRGILAGLLLSFARALGEFGATLMVAGSIVGKTQTLSIAVYEAVQAGQDDSANFLVAVTSITCIAVLLSAGRLVPGRVLVRA